MEINPAIKSLMELLKLSAAPLTENAGDLRLLLRPGDFIRGRILDTIPGEGVFLRLGDNKIFAETSLTLPSNSEIEFVVRSVEPKITLQVKDLSSEGEWQRSALKDLLAFRNGGPLLLEALKNALEEIGNYSDLSVLKETLFRIMQGEDPLPSCWKSMGIDLEARLKGILEKNEEAMPINNLKALLLKLSASAVLTGDKEETASAVRNLLSLVKGYQAASLLLSSTDKSVYLLPVWFNQGSGWGECRLSINKEDERDEPQREQSNVLWEAKFFLTMSCLGMINVHLKVFGKEISCLFYVDETEQREFISNELQDLTSRLLKIGYKSWAIECQDSNRQPEGSAFPLSDLKQKTTAVLNIVA